MHSLNHHDKIIYYPDHLHGSSAKASESSHQQRRSFWPFPGPHPSRRGTATAAPTSRHPRRDEPRGRQAQDWGWCGLSELHGPGSKTGRMMLPVAPGWREDGKGHRQGSDVSVFPVTALSPAAPPLWCHLGVPAARLQPSWPAEPWRVARSGPWAWHVRSTGCSSVLCPAKRLLTSGARVSGQRHRRSLLTGQQEGQTQNRHT